MRAYRSLRDVRLTAAVGDGLLRANGHACGAFVSGAGGRVAIYHFSAKVIARASGRSAVAAAAYRSASALPDDALRRARTTSATRRTWCTRRSCCPTGAPERWADRARAVERGRGGEKRKDAQLAREMEIAMPRELTQDEGVALARDFVAASSSSRAAWWRT